MPLASATPSTVARSAASIRSCTPASKLRTVPVSDTSAGSTLWLLAAFDPRDRQHRRSRRVDAARDDGVAAGRRAGSRRGSRRACVRLRGMAAAPAQHDVEAVGRRHDRAGARLRMAERQVGPVVQRVDGVAREALEQARPRSSRGRRRVPSSAGWKMKCTVPSKRRVRASWRAAPSSMLVWPSWPQPWCTPAWRLACAQSPSSTIGSASMSARRPTLRVAAAAAQRADHAGAADAFVHLEAEQRAAPARRCRPCAAPRTRARDARAGRGAARPDRAAGRRPCAANGCSISARPRPHRRVRPACGSGSRAACASDSIVPPDPSGRGAARSSRS